MSETPEAQVSVEVGPSDVVVTGVDVSSKELAESFTDAKPVDAPAVEPAQAESAESSADRREAEPVEADAAADPSGDDDGEEMGFRDKSGKFRKASKKEALGKMQARIDTLTARLKTAPVPAPAPSSPAPLQGSPTTAAPGPVEPSAPTGKPKFEDFQSQPDALDAWVEAVAEWKAEQAWVKREAAAAESRRAQQASQAQSELQDRIEAFAADKPDFQAVVTSKDLQVSPIIQAVLNEHPDGPAMAYYLGTHLDDALSLALNTVSVPVSDKSAQVAMAKLLSLRVGAGASTGSAPITPSTTSAPPPPGRLGAATRTTTATLESLIARGGEDYDSSGFRERRQAERQRR